MGRGLLMIKGFRNGNKKNTVIKIAVSLILTAAISAGIFFTSYSEDVNKGLADNLIRLHVIANSDSAEDQTLKRSVRDVVLNYMKEQLKGSADIEQTRYLINRDIGRIEALARGEIARWGKNYGVKAMLGSYPFPTKTYGDISLPAGTYEALRIVIGNGEGANWWCVLFPPLCFVDATHGTVPDSVKQDLKKVLSQEEYNLVVSANDDEEIPVKIKFKIVEFFQDSKIRFVGMLNKMFKPTK